MVQTAPVILIADDDLDDQELLEEAFLTLHPDITVHTVLSGQEVRDFLMNCAESDLPELIVLDYNMPRMNGLQILDFLRQQETYRAIPVVFWSTSAAQSLKIDCERAGARFFATKPTDVAGVCALATRMLAECRRPLE